MDELEQQILQCLILDGRMPLRRIGEIVGTSEQTVARRYRAMRDAGLVRVFAGRSGFSRLRQTWTVRIRCRPGSAAQLAEAIAARPDTGWVALVSGGAEIICSTSGPSADTGADGVLRRLPHTAGVLSFSAQSMLRAFAGVTEIWTVLDTALTRQPPAVFTSTVARPQRRRDATVSPGDEPLIAVLARDGRASVAELARELDWPASRVSTRLDGLLKGGAAYIGTDFVPEAFGLHASASMHLTVAPSNLVDVCRALSSHRQTGFVAATTGATNVFAEVVCDTSDALFRYVTEHVGRLPGVGNLDLTPLTRRIKQAGSRVVDGRLVATD